MQLRPLVSQDENDDLQVEQKELYPDANAIENMDIFDENLPTTQENTSEEEPEEKTTELKHQTESLSFSFVRLPEVIVRRTSTKGDTPLGRHRQALNRTQHPIIEIVENHDKRVPSILIQESNQNHERDSAVVSHKNTIRTMEIETQTNSTTRAARPNEPRYNLRVNLTLKKYTDFFTHQIGDTHAALKPVNAGREGTRTHTSQEQTS